jgi:hypothetical protein
MLMPEILPESLEWCRPTLQRSKWYDLFNKDERLELFQGLWSIMEYLTRDLDSETKPNSHNRPNPNRYSYTLP